MFGNGAFSFLERLLTPSKRGSTQSALAWKGGLVEDIMLLRRYV
jgi:hypothetical protein